MSNNIAVVFPGIGYHKDKPLLYYSSKLAASHGYDIINIEYHDMPKKIRGNEEMMRKAAQTAFSQTEEQLKGAGLDGAGTILFIGKSIGTIALAKYAQDHNILAKQIWYTPLIETFSFAGSNVLAFIGDADPWSDVDKIKETATKKGIPLYSYENCNHSLESGNALIDIKNLQDVMSRTDLFI